MRPTFTLLIHARGRPDLATLAATLASLRFTLTRDDVECLALADGEAPIAALLRAEPGIGRVFVPARPCTFIEVRSALLGRARGRFVVLITTPARITDSAWLDRLARALSHEGVGMAGPHGARIDAGWQSLTPIPAGRCDVLTGGPWALRREALLAGAALDPLDVDAGTSGRAVWADAEQSLRVRELGYAVRCLGELGAAELLPDTPDEAAWAALRGRWAGRGLVRAEMSPPPWPRAMPDTAQGTPPAWREVRRDPVHFTATPAPHSPLSAVLRGEGAEGEAGFKEHIRWRERV